MIGTLINVGTVLLGTGVGFLCKKGIPQRIEDAVMKTMGLAVVLIGLTGTLGAMGRVEGGAVSFDGGLLLLVSLVLGVLAGELLKIDDRLGRFGDVYKRQLLPAAAELYLRGPAGGPAGGGHCGGRLPQGQEAVARGDFPSCPPPRRPPPLRPLLSQGERGVVGPRLDPGRPAPGGRLPL